MTKQEKQAFNKQLGQIWNELRALKNVTMKDVKLTPGWKAIQAKHEEFIESNEELKAAIELAYPKIYDQVKALKYPNDIDKTVACLNAITPTEKEKKEEDEK